ncbi:MAG: hypothetical protein ACRYFX_20315 [Janthinobacterium lividum]
MTCLRLLLLLLLSTRLLAQTGDEQFKAALLQTKTGALLVYTSDAHAFTIDIVGKVVPSTEHPNFLTVNGQVLQAAIIGYGSNGDVSDLPEETQKKFLISYQQHESTYFKKELNIPVTNEKMAFVRYGNHLFLSWEYKCPRRDKHQVQQQLYLVTICFNQALVLNCPITKPTEVAQAQVLLAAIGSTLTVKDEPIDLTKLYEELQK